MNGTERTHVDLFTGLGGFSLSAAWNGVRTIAMCEADPKCREFLGKAWPGVPVCPDVREFHWPMADASKRQDDCGGNGDMAEAAGRREGVNASAGGAGPVWLLTAGVPCQPASRAGKQRGTEDDRWLWPEAIRVASEVRATWALFENPPGIGDVGLAGILSDLAGIGYQATVLSIPACSVGAPHRRERYWIVCRLMENAREGFGQCEPGQQRPRSYSQKAAREFSESTRPDSRCTMPDHNEAGPQGTDSEPGADGLCSEYRQGFWDSHVWLPCADGKFRRAPDDSFGVVDGLHRSVLVALGNSIVPQVAAEIIRAMIEAE